MEDEESLQSCALVGQLTDSVEDKVNDFLSNGVVSTGIVVGSIFLTSDELLGMEQLAVRSCADLVDYSWFQVHENCSGDVFASSGFAEEGVERVVSASNGLVGGHLSVRLDTVFKTVQLPAGVSNLDTGLSHVDRDTFTHFCFFFELENAVWRQKRVKTRSGSLETSNGSSKGVK